LPARGTWAIFPQLREIRLTIDLDASHYLYISLHHVTRFEPITATHFDQRYNNSIDSLAVHDVENNQEYIHQRTWSGFPGNPKPNQLLFLSAQAYIRRLC